MSEGISTVDGRPNSRIPKAKLWLGKLVKGHSYWYRAILVLAALGPSCYFVQVYGGTDGLIVSGLNALFVAYVGDFIQLFILEGTSKDKEQASAFHVFVVAWFLPFLLTLSPSIQHILEPGYFDVLIRELNQDLLLHREPTDSRYAEYQALVNRAVMPVFLHSVIFSSLVVLVPLEFFALLFLEKESKRAQRHALIAAGCLDVATLSFLSLVATDYELVSFEEEYSRLVLLVYMAALWFFSLISSFQAIYVAQYQELEGVESFEEYASSQPFE